MTAESMTYTVDVGLIVITSNQSRWRDKPSTLTKQKLLFEVIKSK